MQAAPPIGASYNLLLLTDRDPGGRVPSTQTQGPLSCDVSPLSPRGGVLSRPRWLKADTSSVLRKRHSRAARFSAGTQMKLL